MWNFLGGLFMGGLKLVGSFFTGGSLDSILNTIEKGMDNEAAKEQVKADVTKKWIDAQANLLVGRTWWFQLFFVVPLGVYWSALLWVNAFPWLGWTVHALPSPYYEWAAAIVSALFIVDGGKAILGRLNK
jgi:hypothetical protein